MHPAYVLRGTLMSAYRTYSNIACVILLRICLGSFEHALVMSSDAPSTKIKCKVELGLMACCKGNSGKLILFCTMVDEPYIVHLFQEFCCNINSTISSSYSFMIFVLVTSICHYLDNLKATFFFVSLDPAMALILNIYKSLA